MFYFRLICCNCELVDGWEIARNSAAKIFLDEEVLFVSVRT